MTRARHTTNLVREYMQGADEWVTSSEVHDGIAPTPGMVRRSLDWLVAHGLVEKKQEMFKWKADVPRNPELPVTTITMTSAGGFKVQTISTVDRGQWFRVTRPGGLDVPLNPWDPQHGEISTFQQLVEVLIREGEDPATLRESG